ncbi:MAG: YigZ family protein [Hahellaceae bacterium]|nr:YigZ family protein [Hahellaceae bacterium]MCP5168241.1 YigZ family protein [Hahellaceae bacterium]
MTTLSIPDGFVSVETEVKKSRFIAWADHAASREDAMALLEKARQQYPDARHHCWAYISENGRSAAASDDGEPSGTAGKPILNVLQHKEITDVMLVVIRYFGGIKLGAGGLVRAYSGAAQAAMDALALKHPVAMIRVSFSCDFAQEAQARYWVEQASGVIDTVDYGRQVTLHVQLPEINYSAWRAQAGHKVHIQSSSAPGFGE